MNLTELANMVYSRMQQFWKLDRWVRVTDVEGNPLFKQIGMQVLQNDYDLKVKDLTKERRKQFLMLFVQL